MRIEIYNAHLQTVKDATPAMRYMKTEGPPILTLPENTEGNGSESKTSKEQKGKKKGKTKG